MSREPYLQALPALALSIERFTERVPPDGLWYVLKDGDEVGRFRTLKAAQEAWREVIRQSDWKPRPCAVNPEEARRREQAERWARNRGG